MNTFPMIAEFDPIAMKRLSNNRERYIAQSAATRNGVVAPPPPATPSSLFTSTDSPQEEIAQ